MLSAIAARPRMSFTGMPNQLYCKVLTYVPKSSYSNNMLTYTILYRPFRSIIIPQIEPSPATKERHYTIAFCIELKLDPKPDSQAIPFRDIDQAHTRLYSFANSAFLAEQNLNFAQKSLVQRHHRICAISEVDFDTQLVSVYVTMNLGSRLDLTTEARNAVEGQPPKTILAWGCSLTTGHPYSQN